MNQCALVYHKYYVSTNMLLSHACIGPAPMAERSKAYSRVHSL